MLEHTRGFAMSPKRSLLFSLIFFAAIVGLFAPEMLRVHFSKKLFEEIDSLPTAAQRFGKSVEVQIGDYETMKTIDDPAGLLIFSNALTRSTLGWNGKPSISYDMVLAFANCRRFRTGCYVSGSNCLTIVGDDDEGYMHRTLSKLTGVSKHLDNIFQDLTAPLRRNDRKS